MSTPFYKKQEAFDKWHADNPLVWKYFEKFAFEVLANGKKKISHWLIINRIRWEVYILTTGSEFKISNEHIAFYARLWRKTYPQHKDLFNIKRMAGEVWLEDTQ